MRIIRIICSSAARRDDDKNLFLAPVSTNGGLAIYERLRGNLSERETFNSLGPRAIFSRPSRDLKSEGKSMRFDRVTDTSGSIHGHGDPCRGG